MANALLEMYTKRDMFEEAKEEFDTMQHTSTTSWNMLNVGYSQHGNPKNDLKKCN